MPSTHLALEFTDHSLHLATASLAKGTSTLTHLMTLDRGEAGAGGVPHPDTVAALRQALRSLKIRPSRTVIILPKSQVTTRRVTLPSNDPAELTTMAQFEAERHIPFHPERHIVAHHVVSLEGIEGAHVFLAAADEPIVTQALALAHAADLVVDQITVSSAAGAAALLIAEPQAAAERVVALIDIGAESADISILRRGDLLFTRSVSGGVRALLAPVQEGGAPLERDALAELVVGRDHPDPGRAQVIQQFIARLGGELRRTHEFTRREYECPPIEEILVAGEGSLASGLAEALGQAVGLPGRTVDLARLAVRASREIAHPTKLAPHFTCAGALLEPLPPGAIQINLAPPSYRREREAQRLRQVAIVTALLAVIVLALAALHLKLSLDSLRESANAYQRQVRELRPFVEEMDDKRTQIEIIQRFIDERNSALAILDFLSGLEMMPPRQYQQDDPSITTSLIDFKYDREKGSLELSGYVRDFNQIATLRGELLATGFFRTVTISDRRPTPLRERSVQVTRFTFLCELATGAETGTEEASEETLASAEVSAEAIPAAPPGPETLLAPAPSPPAMPPPPLMETTVGGIRP